MKLATSIASMNIRSRASASLSQGMERQFPHAPVSRLATGKGRRLPAASLVCHLGELVRISVPSKRTLPGAAVRSAGELVAPSAARPCVERRSVSHQRWPPARHFECGNIVTPRTVLLRRDRRSPNRTPCGTCPSVHCRYCSRLQPSVVEGAKIVEKMSDRLRARLGPRRIQRRLRVVWPPRSDTAGVPLRSRRVARFPLKEP